MRSLILITTLASFLSICARAQDPKIIDSLKKKLALAKQDTVKADLLHRISFAYITYDTDSAFNYAKKGLKLCQDINFDLGKVWFYNDIGNVYINYSDHKNAIENLLLALKIVEKLGDKKRLQATLTNIGNAYGGMSDFKEALAYYYKANYLSVFVKDTSKIITIVHNIGQVYQYLDQLDSAIKYEQDAYQLSIQQNNLFLESYILNDLGTIHYKLKNDDLAIAFYKKSEDASKNTNNLAALTGTYFLIASFYRDKSKDDSMFRYAYLTLDNVQHFESYNGLLEISNLLYDYFKKKNSDSAQKYLELIVSATDTLNSMEKISKFNC